MTWEYRNLSESQDCPPNRHRIILQGFLPCLFVRSVQEVPSLLNKLKDFFTLPLKIFMIRFFFPIWTRPFKGYMQHLRTAKESAFSEITMLTVFVQPPCSLIIFIQSVQM